MRCIEEKCAAWCQHDFNESWFQCAIDPSGHSRKKGQNNKCCIDEEIEDRKRALAELEDLRKEITERNVLWTITLEDSEIMRGTGTVYVDTLSMMLGVDINIEK